MRTLWVLCATAAALLAASVSPASVTRIECGIYRWPVKTLADPDAPKVNLTPKATTIDALRRRKVVVGIGGARGIGTERTTFRVQARLVEFKLEPDGDIHLVIADPRSGNTMISEFPNQTCTRGSLPGARTKIKKARQALVDACGFPPNSDFRTVDGTATIDGVGFFDRPHGHGAPKNGIELHPVLRFVGHCSQ